MGSRLLAQAALFCMVAACGPVACARGFSIYADRFPTDQEAAANFTGAKHEPRYGCYAGAFIDLDDTIRETYTDQTGKVRKIPDLFEKLTGKSHATYFYYMGYGRPLATDWIQKLGGDSKIVHIALEPNGGLDKVKDDAYLDSLAKGLGQTDTPVFIRFASEMNGKWVKYGGNPKLYREKFQLVAKKMHTLAPNVAMVWCPYATPVDNIASYYPGDSAVDWVGVNIYSVTYYDQKKGQPGFNDHPVEKLDYIYGKYSGKKPVMVGEFGATHFSAVENASTVDFAVRSIKGMYESLPRRYPRVKCINYFNTNNLDLEHRQNNNYAVTQNRAVLELYRRLVGQDYFLSEAVDKSGFMAHSMVAIPVSGEKAPPLYPKSPMPIAEKQVFKGTVRLSGWVEDGTGKANMHFLVDGKKVYIATTRDDWGFELDTKTLSNGPHKLELKAERSGKVLGQAAVSVVIRNP